MSKSYNIIIGFIKQLQDDESLSTHDLRSLLDEIYEEPKADWDDIQANAVKGRILSIFLNELELEGDFAIRVAHLSFLYLSRTLELLDDKSQFDNMMDFMLNRMNRAPFIMETYWDRIVLLTNHGKLFYNTVGDLASRSSPASINYRVSQREAPKHVDTMIFNDMDEYRNHMEEMKKQNRELPYHVPEVLNLAVPFLDKGLSKDDIQNGKFLRGKVYSYCQKMIDDGDFDF